MAARAMVAGPGGDERQLELADIGRLARRALRRVVSAALPMTPRSRGFSVTILARAPQAFPWFKHVAAV